MELRAERCADVVILRPAGRIDHTNAEDFERSLDGHLAGCKSGCDALLFDLSGVEYISSAGLRVLMQVSKSVAPAGGKVVLANPQKVVGEILEISRFQHVIPVHSTVASGLAQLSPQAAAQYAGS